MAKLNFTAKSVAALKPGNRRVTYWDFNLPGFGMRVTPNGIKTFVALYRHAGRKRWLTVGTYPPLTLADARAKAKDALHAAEHGGDPAAEKRMEARAETFKELCQLYLDRYAKPRKKSWKEDERRVNAVLRPRWGAIHAKDVTRADVRLLLEELAENAPIEANRVLALIRKIFNWAISKDLVSTNPCVQIQPPGREQRRDRVLTEDEIKAVWRATEQEDLLMGALFKLRLLTLQRGGEVAGMQWAEIDMNNAVWTIPAERSKNGLPHRVPLSAPAMRILESLGSHQTELKNTAKRSSPYVFYAPDGDGHVEELQKAAQRIRANAKALLGISEEREFDFVAHDLRRTAATMMTSMGTPRLIVQRILNHAETGVTAVYDRASYDGEKRDALDRWASRLLMIISDLRVISASSAGGPS